MTVWMVGVQWEGYYGLYSTKEKADAVKTQLDNNERGGTRNPEDYESEYYVVEIKIDDVFPEGV